jgi:anti-sigma regulatory factor (Ser/Thr protein kinase)
LAGPTDRLELDLDMPAVPESVTQARHAMADLAIASDSVREGVALAVSEAVGNAVVHAFRGVETGTVRLRVSGEGSRVHVTVSDNGTGMRPNLDRGGLGVGIGLMRHAADELRLESSDDGTTVSMVFEEAG